MSNDFLECHDFKVAQTFKSLIRLTKNEIITRKEINNNLYNLCFEINRWTWAMVRPKVNGLVYKLVDSHLKGSGRECPSFSRFNRRYLIHDQTVFI